LLNNNISSRCPHNTVNFGPLTAEIGLSVWGTPANFNRFRALTSLLQQRRSPEANQTLHDLWSSSELVHYIYYIYVQNSLCVQVLRSPILVALLHGTPAAVIDQTLWCATRNGITKLFCRRRHLYSVWRPSGWASAHILVTL